jgi:hypothetical protein
MNKRMFLLVILLLLTIVLISIKIYFNTKNNVLNEYNHYILLEKKVKEIYALKQKYKLNRYKINYLKRFCKVSDKSDKCIIECKNLDEKKFNIVQRQIFRNNFKINNFEIDKNKTVSLYVEIEK